MKKISLLIGIVFSGMAMAQYDGRVGITTQTPRATLEIEKNGASKLNGILIPKVTKAEAEEMGGFKGIEQDNKLQESTLVYIEDFSANSGQYTSKVDAKGFYYFDGIEWVKMGGASSSTSTSTVLGPATGVYREIARPLTSAMWNSNDFAIGVTGTTGALELPDPVANAGRIIALRNTAGVATTISGNPPSGNSGIKANSGLLMISNGTNWVVIAGF